ALFAVLRVAPVIGRTFSAGEDQLGKDNVVLLSYGLWRRRFNADPSIAGRTVTINGADSTVIGVMPPGFEFPGDTGTQDIFTAPAAELWVPLALTSNAWSARSAHYLEVIGRLKSGVTIGQAQAEMDSIEQQLVKENPRDYIGTDVKIVPLAAQVVGGFRAALLVLFGAVVLVMLIGCANVANLLLARATSRRREVAVRAALGASRPRLVRQLLTESLVLSAIGGIFGVGTAFLGIKLLKLILPANFPRTSDIHLDAMALIFTAAASIATGLFFGLAPAFQGSKTDVTEALKSGARGAEGFARNRLRSFLVVGEVALAMILLAGTGLLLRSFLSLERVNPGFSPDNVLTMEISLPDARYPAPRKTAFFTQVLERVRALPGVEFAGTIAHLPLSGEIESYALQLPGGPDLPNEFASPSCHVVMPGYFEAMKIPLTQGRYFDDRDGAKAPNALIVNEAVVRNVFPGQNPIGKQLLIGFNNFTGEIVGVVANTSHLSLDAPPYEEVYTPYVQAPLWSTMTLTVRTAGAPMAEVGPIGGIIRSMDADQPISRIRTMDELVGASVATQRFRALLLGLFGLSALLLGAIGIYGVMSYSVSQRTREIGIRIALGAERREVITMVLKQGLVLTLAGIAIGLIGSLFLTGLLSTMLYDVRSTDPYTFAGVTLVLATVSMVANCLPALRATRVDPMIALRYE
ncbi:MAG TPA: ABC transporter permease, partial [Blastocatellia bacterium]